MKWILVWLNINWLGPTYYDTEEGCKEVGKNAAIGLKTIFRNFDDDKTKWVCVKIESKEKDT